MTAKEKAAAQEKFRQLAASIKRGDNKEEVARLKRELEDIGILCDVTKPKK
jgi:hypothetical protein